jgi:glycosyltransferase involved in cell wall biosynthesis
MRELARPKAAIAVAQRSLRMVTKLSSLLVAVEPKIARHAVEALGAKNVVVIENGADLSAATPGDRGEAKRRLNLDEHTKYLAFTGTLVPEQRFDLLLEAHAMLGNFSLLIAGGGPQAPLLERAAKDQKRIVLLGTVPHATAIDVLRAAHACINVRDGDLGMKCFEYAAVGRRFVAFRYEGTERLEALYPGEEAVFLVEERSAAGLARAIEAAIGAEDRHGPLPVQAIERARSTIGWDHTARRIAEVLASCA